MKLKKNSLKIINGKLTKSQFISLVFFIDIISRVYGKCLVTECSSLLFMKAVSGGNFKGF